MTDSRDALKVKKALAYAEKELVDADELAKASHPMAKKMARRARRIAKRLHSKAQRRSAKIACGDY